MEAINHEGFNVQFAEHQEEYITLPAHRDDKVKCTTCWKLTWRERFQVLFKGKFFLQILTFNKPLQPLKMQVDNPLEVSK